uniref:Uncharacterized protein n=1 Tax=Ascaris lumbricoides TaxID=6252 RepID=A0A9J2P131_ASCLU
METSEKKATSVGGGCRKKRPAPEFTDVYVEFEGLRRSRRFFFNLHKRLTENREKERKWMEELRKEELAVALERCTHFPVGTKAEMPESVSGTPAPSDHRPNAWAVFQVNRSPKFA